MHSKSWGRRCTSPRVPPASSISARASASPDLIRALPERAVNIVAHSNGGLERALRDSRQLGLGGAGSLRSFHHRDPPPGHAPGLRLATPSGGSRDCCGGSSTFTAFGDLATLGMARVQRDRSRPSDVAYASCGGKSGRLRTNPLLWPFALYLAERSGPNDGGGPRQTRRLGREVLREIDADHWAQMVVVARIRPPFPVRVLLRELPRPALLDGVAHLPRGRADRHRVAAPAHHRFREADPDRRRPVPGGARSCASGNWSPGTAASWTR